MIRRQNSPPRLKPEIYPDAIFLHGELQPIVCRVTIPFGEGALLARAWVIQSRQRRHIVMQRADWDGSPGPLAALTVPELRELLDHLQESAHPTARQALQVLRQAEVLDDPTDEIDELRVQTHEHEVAITINGEEVEILQVAEIPQGPAPEWVTAWMGRWQTRRLVITSTASGPMALHRTQVKTLLSQLVQLAQSLTAPSPACQPCSTTLGNGRVHPRTRRRQSRP